MRRAGLLLAIGGLAWAGGAAAADLQIRLAGVNGGGGRLMVAVYGGPEAFMQPARSVAALQLPAAAGTVSATIALPPGRYAVSAFHDADGNGQLATNLLGLPTEGYGFSNDARGTAGPPSFEAAAVPLGETGGTAVLTLQY